MKPLTKNSRQAYRKLFLLIIFITSFFCLNACAQSKVDYKITSNFLKVDTLIKGSIEHRIFMHFLEWDYRKTNNIKPLKLKDEFRKLDIKTQDKEFDIAYSFFRNVLVYHKKSVENLNSFNKLKKTKKNPDLKF